MPEGTQNRFRDRLLTEAIAEWLQFDVLARRLPGPDLYPPYLLVAVGIGIEYGIFDLYNYFISGKNSFLVEPNSLAVPAMVILAVVGGRYIHDSYASAIAALRIEDRDSDIDATPFESLVPFRLRVGVLLVVVIVNNAFGFFVLGWGNLIAIDGIGLFLFGTLVTFPLIYLPAIVDFGLSYFAVHVSVPRRLQRADLGLFFYDPRKMGGFGPIGELLKRSYYVYTGALLLYFVQTYAPVLLSEFTTTPYGTPGPVIQLTLSVAWIVGILTIGYSMSRVHSIMKAEKDRRIRELEDDLRNTMDKPFDIHEAEIADESEYERITTRLQHVRDTKTYPTTFTMWSQIFISVLLPQALNLAVGVI
ncbi:hypothetical protein [Haloplanus aerogenes]|uniref:Uncharacterized protein n=1 Tax=Haloplanus aerogenes TaxID=660522 RepID=A0A3M0DS56_9EURY|nr:hypothetical protein [Haloplanus aerogenes]AZH24185.1 hypothetical protein DU502_01805 [Haloplanus aerogenes]RMB24195.1 hypothetical protein ATH50_1435 [Haloplanus aerogenes]